MSLADALLEPTRIYVKPVLSAIAKHSCTAIHACAHITGGGITENLNRALPNHLDAVVDINTLPQIPVIDYVVKSAGLSLDQALTTFNMGMGFALIVSRECADDVMETLAEAGEQAFVAGEIVAEGSACVRYRS